MSAVYKTVTPSGVTKQIKDNNGLYALNSTNADIPGHKVLTWLDDGSIALATSAVVDTSRVPGISDQLIAKNTLGLVLETGKVPGILTGLNANPGQAVFLSETPGELTLHPSVGDSGIIRIGFAQPADGLTGPANDLFISIEYVSQP